MPLPNVDYSAPKQAKVYTAKQAITRIENILDRVQPSSARQWVLDYVSNCMTSGAPEPDPRQGKLPIDDHAG